MELSTSYLTQILNYFHPDEVVEDYFVIPAGHINLTIRVSVGNKHYLLQQINDTVFREIQTLLKSKSSVVAHLNTRIDYPIKFYKTLDGDLAFENWTCCDFLEEVNSYEACPRSKIAFEMGKGLQYFSKGIEDLNVENYPEIIKDFHRMSSRVQDLNKAVNMASKDRLEAASELLRWVRESERELFALEQMIDKRETPQVLTHNDPKIGNFLFSSSDDYVALIDLDTIMPGYRAFDFGDAVRSVTANQREDDRDFQNISFDMVKLEAFLKGYGLEGNLKLSLNELRAHLAGIFHIIGIMSIRFLTDYLNNDVYYKINYPEHNLTRARNQMLLFQEFILHKYAVQNLVYQHLA